MTYKEELIIKNEQVKERFELARARMIEIALGEASDMPESLQTYFRETAALLVRCQQLFIQIGEDWLEKAGVEEKMQENESFYQELFPENYGASYANPDYACQMLGADLGKLLSFLYRELREERIFAFEQDMTKFTILHELFLEIYGMFCMEKVTFRQLKETIYWFLYDYADEWCGWRVRELVDPGLTYAVDIIMQSDLSKIDYLYSFGDYISEDERKMAAFLAGLPQEDIDAIARSFTRGYQKGFEIKGVDLSKKSTVDIRYNLGFERIIRAAILQFEEMGLKPIIYRGATNTLNRKISKPGYLSSSPNEQFEYDHHFDQAIYLDKRMVDRKIACMRQAYEAYEEEAAGYAGPAVMEVFGPEPFSPVRKETALRLSERQQNLTVEYNTLSGQLTNEYIDANERSFTIIAYPTPAIGEPFEEIFRAIEQVNNLDVDLYERIQERMIEVLDQSECVRIMGRGKNMTNLSIRLQELKDPSKETLFENCLADVNIPVGEVFTSPKLEKTEGLLHVTEVFLNGFKYKNLKIWFEDGMITDYSCDNFEDVEKGKAFIKENILYNRETLPMGEFAIGTNTVAYVMAAKYDIMHKLPILIAEKTGPHMAVGDTCYSHCEDVPMYNPDGKEMIARDNSCSLHRKTDPKKAYFNCHTDITIPYEEIGRINAVTADHIERPIILDGRFVLEGTMELNKPFAGGQEDVMY